MKILVSLGHISRAPGMPGDSLPHVMCNENHTQISIVIIHFREPKEKASSAPNNISSDKNISSISHCNYIILCK